jgi:hypothetical protein
VNPPPKPLKFFVRLLENFLQAGQQSFNVSHISSPVKSVEHKKFSGRPSTSKTTENVENNVSTHPQRPLLSDL